MPIKVTTPSEQKRKTVAQHRIEAFRERAAQKEQSYYRTQHAPTKVDKKRYANRPELPDYDIHGTGNTEPLWKKRMANLAKQKLERSTHYRHKITERLGWFNGSLFFLQSVVK